MKNIIFTAIISITSLSFMSSTTSRGFVMELQAEHLGNYNQDLFYNPYFTQFKGDPRLTNNTPLNIIIRSPRLRKSICVSRFGDGKVLRGEYLKYSDLLVWNNHFPEWQIIPPAVEKRDPREFNEKNFTYVNPFVYAEKYCSTGPLGVKCCIRAFCIYARKEEKCWMTKQEILNWNLLNPTCHIIFEIPDTESYEDDTVDDLPINEEQPLVDSDYDVEVNNVFVDTIPTINSFTPIAYEFLQDLLITTVVNAVPYVIQEFNNNDTDENGNVQRSDISIPADDIEKVNSMTNDMNTIGKVTNASPSSAFYIDPAGLLLRDIELKKIKAYRKESVKTSIESVQTKFITAVEESDRTRLNLKPSTISFSPYFLACNSKYSIIKRRKCKKRVLYLKDALKAVNLIIVPYSTYSPYNQLFKTDRGISEQINQKYSAILTTIYLELESVLKDNPHIIIPNPIID
jgi:hypothetical protein